MSSNQSGNSVSLARFLSPMRRFQALWIYSSTSQTVPGLVSRLATLMSIICFRLGFSGNSWKQTWKVCKRQLHIATLLHWMPMLSINVHPLANLMFPKTSTLCVPRGSLKQLQAIIMKICDFPSCQRLSSSVIDLKVLIVSARPKQLKVSYSS